MMKRDDIIANYVRENGGKVWELMSELKKNKYTLEEAKECFGYMYAYFNEPKEAGECLGVVTEPYYTEFDLMRTCYAIVGIESSNGNYLMAPSSFNRRLAMICKGFTALNTVLNVYLIDRYYYNYSYKMSLLPEEIREHWLGEHSVAEVPGLYYFALEVVELLEYIGGFTEFEAEDIKNLYRDLFNYSDNVVKYQDKAFLFYYDKVTKKFEDSMSLVDLGFDKDRFSYMYKLFTDLMDDLYTRNIKKEKIYNKIIPYEIFRVGGIDED